MKKIFKNPLFTFVLGAILFGGIGTVVAVNITSSMVEYDNSSSGLEATTVEGAINELYVAANKKMALNTFGTELYNASYGVRNKGRSVNITVNKGKYIILVVMGNSGGKGDNNYRADTVPITCSPSCNILNKISGRALVGNGSSYSFYVRNSVYYADIRNDSTKLTSTTTLDGKSEHGQGVTIQAIPINE